MNSGIVRGKYVFTEPADRHSWKIIENGAVRYEGSHIVEIGDAAEIIARHPDITVLGDKNTVVLPGFVNGHHHIGLTPLQKGTADLSMELWSARNARTRDVDSYLDTLYAALEMIASGVTTVQHIRFVRGDAEFAYAESDAFIRAFTDIGMRVSYAYGARDQNRFQHHLDDDVFIASLPPEVRDVAKAQVGLFSMPLEQFFDLYQSLIDRYKGHETVAMQLAPPNLQWMTDRSLAMHADFSEKNNSYMHMHFVETMAQKEYASRRSGNGDTALDYLDRYGLLTSKLTLGHGVWLNQHDIERIAETGVHICHNCSSNFRIRSGIAPLNVFEKHGINVAIGIDEAGINDDRDMLQEMRLVKIAHRVPGYKIDGVPTSAQVLRMATVGGALTTPFGQQIGRLAVGAFADMVLLDWNQIAKPYLDPDTDVLDAIIMRAKQKGVRTVVINGEVVLKDGRFTRVDPDIIMDDIEKRMSQPLTEAEIARKEASKKIFPFFLDFYQGYVQHTPEPFYLFNSKS